MHGISVGISNQYQILTKKIRRIKSSLSKQKVTLTTSTFTPILPYRATRFDTIYTCMKNFEDLLKQRELLYGSLSCNHGVHRTAKEFNYLNCTSLIMYSLD